MAHQLNLSLTRPQRRAIDRRVRSGQYSSEQDVVRAGLAALEQQEVAGDFSPGEWETILKHAERSIRLHGTVDAAKVFSDLRHRSRRRKMRKSA
ncbi:MAG TPA: type II toxin-antitoxin system ParD family antitoxin [Tepidisphaeraceae bacterium]|nr:type II toxin-antitoxin system ParD family antitoxin [Tepidisphaeraceae bacterium]